MTMMCARDGCQRLATKRPVWSFAADPRPGSPRSRSMFDIGVCDEHATPDAFMPVEESWQHIEAGLRAIGRAAPDRSTFRLEYEPYEDAAATMARVTGSEEPRKH